MTTPLEQQAREAAMKLWLGLDPFPVMARSAFVDGFLAAAEPREREIERLKTRQTAQEILDTGGEWRELGDGEVVLLTMAVMPDLLEEDQKPGRDRLARLVCKAHELLCRAENKDKEVAALKAKVRELEERVKFRDEFIRERYRQAFTDFFPPIPLPGEEKR